MDKAWNSSPEIFVGKIMNCGNVYSILGRSTVITGMKDTVENGEKQIRNSSSSMKEIMQIIINISRDVQDINKIVHEQIQIIGESRIRTDKIQDMAQTMRVLTGEEKNNSAKLKSDIEKVFSASQSVAKTIQDLHGSAEKLKSLSDKLQIVD